MSKGSNRRPSAVPQKTVDERWDKVFGKSGAFDFLRRLTGTVEAPADWAAEHDHYLYGAPKRSP